MVNDPGLLLIMEYLPMGSLLDYFRVSLTKPTLRELMKFALDVAEVKYNFIHVHKYTLNIKYSLDHFTRCFVGNGIFKL